eukprot:5170082-Lingulodinium_polyedra.AAC.1
MDLPCSASLLPRAWLPEASTLIVASGPLDRVEWANRYLLTTFTTCSTLSMPSWTPTCPTPTTSCESRQSC